MQYVKWKSEQTLKVDPSLTPVTLKIHVPLGQGTVLFPLVYMVQSNNHEKFEWNACNI